MFFTQRCASSALRLFFLSLTVLVVGCAATPQAPVAMQHDVLNSKAKVGVMMSALPELDVHLPGAGCLLCLATAEAMNSSLSKHVTTLQPNEFSLVKTELIRLLTEKGVNTTPIEKPFSAADFPKLSTKEPNTSRRDFSQLRTQFDITHLLVVDVQLLGMWRSYANYVPTSDPMAYLKASSYLVDLQSHQYMWFLPLEIKKPSDASWDEPPNFPGLTNAYYQVLEEGREAIVAEF
jgi:hypothetical protein